MNIEYISHNEGYKPHGNGRRIGLITIRLVGYYGDKSKYHSVSFERRDDSVFEFDQQTVSGPLKHEKEYELIPAVRKWAEEWMIEEGYDLDDRFGDDE